MMVDEEIQRRVRSILELMDDMPYDDAVDVAYVALCTLLWMATDFDLETYALELQRVSNLLEQCALEAGASLGSAEETLQ